ncbi:MAG: hypothetical protein EP332_03265 [Bacteroidetes bacterium]|nr:MAG: hypothetical protein EP332_03265 [Bacteroidota bacterium]
MKTRFLLPYLPDQDWLKGVVRAAQPVLDLQSHFVKQTPRNRAYIVGPNGVQALVVPIQGRNKRQAFEDVKIAYQENWVRQHVNAIRSAYGSAPYFEYLFPALEAVLESKPEYLKDLNKALLLGMLKALKLKIDFSESQSFELGTDEKDHRSEFLERNLQAESYPQVFQEKFGFVAGLSGIDRMMNDLAGIRQDVS